MERKLYFVYHHSEYIGRCWADEYEVDTMRRSGYSPILCPIQE